MCFIVSSSRLLVPPLQLPMKECLHMLDDINSFRALYLYHTICCIVLSCPRVLCRVVSYLGLVVAVDLFSCFLLHLLEYIANLPLPQYAPPTSFPSSFIPTPIHHIFSSSYCSLSMSCRCNHCTSRVESRHCHY